MMSKKEYNYITDLYKNYENNLFEYYTNFDYGRDKKLSLFDIANNLPDFADS